MSNQPDLDFTPMSVRIDKIIRGDEPQAHARRTDRPTSVAAAASVSNFTAVETAILETLSEYGPMRDEKLIEKFREYCPSVRASDSGIRSRRADLVRLGQIRATEKREKTKSGRDSVVWEIVKS